MAKPFPVERTVGTSGANAPQTVSSPARGRRVLKMVTVAYSAALLNNVTVTTTLNAGAGAGYDTRLSGIDMLVGERWAGFIPEFPIPLSEGDSIDVVAPAGGAAVTSGVQIYTEPDGA